MSLSRLQTRAVSIDGVHNLHRPTTFLIALVGADQLTQFLQALVKARHSQRGESGS